MSNVTDIHGSGSRETDPNFDPDNVLNEPLSQSAFDEPVDVDDGAEHAETPTVPPKRNPLFFVAIAFAAVLFAGVAYQTLKPEPSHAPAPRAAAITPTTHQTPHQAPVMEAQPMPPSLEPAPNPVATAMPGAPTTVPTYVASPTDHPVTAPVTATAASSAAPMAAAANPSVGPQTESPAPQPSPQAPSAQMQALADKITALEVRVDALQTIMADLQHATRKAVATGTPATKPRDATRPTPAHVATAKPANPRPTVPESHRVEPSSSASVRAPKLKAVLVGQAWFEMANGHTITVTPGETVSGLGRVTSIDADSGEVRFADGSIAR